MTNVFLLGFSFQLNTVVNWIVSTLKVHGTQFVFVMCSISGIYIYILYIYTYIDIYSIIFIDIHRYEIWITTVFNTYASQIQAIQIWLQTLQIASLHAVNICCWRIFHMTYIIHLEKKMGHWKPLENHTWSSWMFIIKVATGIKRMARLQLLQLNYSTTVAKLTNHPSKHFF